MGLDKLTKSQFHTVWTKAAGLNSYNKKFFQELMKELETFVYCEACHEEYE